MELLGASAPLLFKKKICYVSAGRRAQWLIGGGVWHTGVVDGAGCRWTSKLEPSSPCFAYIKSVIAVSRTVDRSSGQYVHGLAAG
jgi:hypothetical protein